MPLVSPLRAALRVFVTFVLATCACPPARAEGPPAESKAETAPAAIVPPRLVQDAIPDFPESQRRRGDRFEVGLKLTVDREGRVTAAEVIDFVSPELYEAARECAFRLRFAPARRTSGEALPAKILFRIVFEAKERSPDAFATAPALHDTPASVAPAAVAATNPPPPPSEPSRPKDAPSEVSVLGKQTDSRTLQRSAEAVVVYDLRKAHAQSADMGELLARIQGVTVRRDGGLGSNTKFSLGGLSGDQIRFYVDGIPLEYTGFPSNIANLPVNLFERIEIYRGVVPIRFGGDALGGAVNMVTDQSFRSRAGLSYQLGSFGTHRLTLDSLYASKKTGFIAGATVFADTTRNDYAIDVEIPDAEGTQYPATVRRFHDRYSATGVKLQVGLIDRPWARRLILDVFRSDTFKEIQHNLVMSLPYGEVHYDENVTGATLRYQVPLGKKVELELAGNYSRREVDFYDVGKWVYDWTGNTVRPRGKPGEISGEPTDQTIWQDAVFSRAFVRWAVARQHELRFAVTENFATRTGEDRTRAAETRDPLAARRDLLQVVLGAEYELKLVGDRLANIVFVKDYLYHASSEELLPGGIPRARVSDSHTQGAGDSLRFEFTPWLLGKASYEYTTRLPRPDEVFGNGVLVLANLELEPETSHNVNIGPRIDLDSRAAGTFIVDVNAFLRDADNQIVLLGNDRTFKYQNVFKVRSFGVESAATWVSPGSRLLSLGGTLTWLDTRNASDQGSFGEYEGDRLPNTPWLTGSWHARLHFKNMPTADDVVEPYYHGRYTNWFYRGWESPGRPSSKQSIQTQVTHTVGISWLLRRGDTRWGTSFEVDNVTDAMVFDNFGVQRPGRAFYLKLVGGI